MKSATTTTIAIILALRDPGVKVRANTRSVCELPRRKATVMAAKVTATTTVVTRGRGREGGRRRGGWWLDAEPPMIVHTKTARENLHSPYRIARGGAIVDVNSVSTIDDEDLDQLVDVLISGLDGSDDEECRASYLRASSDDGMPPASGNENHDCMSDRNEVVVPRSNTGESRIVDDHADILRGAARATQINDSREQRTRSIATMAENASSTIRTEKYQSPAEHFDDSRTTARSSSATSNVSTPTNAYYRFVVRRGPRGHKLASFTLLAVQFVYTYIPVLYHSIATILLRMHIYDPRVLYEKDRQRRMRTMYGPKMNQGRGLTSKIFGTSRTQRLQRVRIQKHADEEAANKLKQLYRTMKVGNGLGMLSEVKYRYLSVAFRRKHGLGREYRTEKPRVFMGEIVKDSANSISSDESFRHGLGSMESSVTIDDEADDQAQAVGETASISSSLTDRSMSTRGKTSRRQPPENKRIIIRDWVVNAFACDRSPSTDASGVSINLKTSSLWKTVDRAAIVEAAWESRAAEHSAAKRRVNGNDVSIGKSSNNVDRDASDDNYVDGAHSTERGTVGSVYSASKVFQSVMTRVGSNGRIFGAYPNDAPPIEQCAHRRGVMSLARKYGYGQIEQDFSEDDDDSWGGGDF